MATPCSPLTDATPNFGQASCFIALVSQEHRVVTGCTRAHSMHRPRNHQPRPPRQHDSGRRGTRPPRQTNCNVPTMSQVVPGAAVSIVQKADQLTGREVQGIVQDLLTRGDHPRGIKVRLQDGRVGRVQRMAGEGAPTTETTLAPSSRPNRILRMEEDVRKYDAYPEGPPERSLADYFPAPTEESPIQSPSAQVDHGSSATARCPICDAFEGDEVAVSRHVETHLT